ncbi:MAG: hypothetical protein HY907_15960 [Deltaproteobacteria bacterium]|nr:hypothetical protein [Deltaproteobacteria bacterium]
MHGRSIPWCLAILASCGTQRPREVEPAARASAGDAATVADSGGPPPEAPDDAPSTDASVAAQASPAGCVAARVGLDLRALPVGTSTSGIDMFVAGQIDDIRRLVPAGVSAEFFVTSGVSSFDAVFRAGTPEDAAAACRRTLDAWLPTAPRLPVIMEPAATAGPCEPCASPEPPQVADRRPP